ncbi:MAG: ABC transporter ATP-binding protein [Actinomycetes bacterium]
MSEQTPLVARMTGDAGALVALDEVSVRFPGRGEPALRGVSLRLGHGEQLVVLGASGSGKSTLLQAVTGVVPHTVNARVTGQVTVAGAETQETSVVERSRYLGVLAQDPAAGVCLPVVEQELALPLENRAADPVTIGPRLDAALDAVGAGALRPRNTASLAGGEGQRVALAAALVADPEVLLLDEPTSMLDPEGLASVRDAVSRAIERYRPAVVLVEHRLDEWAGHDGSAGLPARALALDETGSVLAAGPTTVVLREHARELLVAGCWLPLDAELLALTGTEGGLLAPANGAFLRDLAADAPEPADDIGAATAEEPLLRTVGLAVGHPGLPRGSRRRRGGKDSAAAPLLSGVDLAVWPGEVVAVLGGNGVGKSTLLLALTGLLEPLAGRVDGRRPGLVFQNADHQFVATTVRQEIGHGLPADLAADVARQQLARHRLEHLAEQNPFRLSGGEKRRLSLAAMLAHDRPVLLADEPTLGLDRRDTVATADTLRAVASAGGAVVLASHDLRTVAGLADRVVVLGHGSVLADGPTAAVLNDDAVLRRAGLALPPVVAWLLAHVSRSAVGPVLRRLDDAVRQPSAAAR